MMNPMRALALVEGLEEADDDEEMIAAWQFLVDTGMAWKLPGRFGRTAAQMIEEGIIES
jgi:hypothetical protein